MNMKVVRQMCGRRLTSHSLPTSLEQCIMDNYLLPQVWMFVSAHRQSLDLSSSLTDSNCMAEENYFLKACHEYKLHFSQFFLSPTILSYFFPPFDQRPFLSLEHCLCSTTLTPGNSRHPRTCAVDVAWLQENEKRFTRKVSTCDGEHQK